MDAVLGRLSSGKLKPNKAFELSYALLTSLTARLRAYTAELTKEVWRLEQRVTGGHLGDPESFLDEMFRARHGLLTVSTMAALSREVYGRMVTIEAFGPGAGQALLEDAVDQFQHLSVMADTSDALPAGNDRVLPGADQYQDDCRRRTAGGDRRRYAAGHGVVVGAGHEPDRE